MESQEIISNIESIYDKYSIPLNVQRHMFEVAAVAEIICDNCKEKINKEDIVASCLIHDLGNLIKVKFDEGSINLLDVADRKKIDFFKKQRAKMQEKYGENAENANSLIAEELGANKKVIELVSHKAIHIENEKFASNDLDGIIVAYADMRVSPHGIVTMQERMDEYYKRYKVSEDKKQEEHSKQFAPLIKQLEKDLFKKLKIKPEDITNSSTKKYFDYYKKSA